MTHTVHCQKFGKELPGLEKPPFPGPKGQEIFDHTSQAAWDEWQAHQTRLINEKHLNMTDFSHRKYLMEQMDRFLRDETFDQAEGYVPESDEADESKKNQ